MRLTKEQKGLAVLDALLHGRKTTKELRVETELTPSQVRDGVDWVRDYDENALVVQRENGTSYFKVAESAEEVAEHVAWRSKALYKMGLRLERMTANALALWPNSKLLKIMHRHLSRMREDVEELV